MFFSNLVFIIVDVCFFFFKQKTAYVLRISDWSSDVCSSDPLFLLDEFAALGRLEPVERAMGLMAGYGLQLWPILQDMHQLRALYGERAGTFLSNAGVLQAFGVNDHATAELLSKSMGQETLEFRTAGYSETHGSIFERAKHTRSISTQVSARNLMNPDEIMRMGPDRSEEHTSELQSLMSISYAVFCLKKKTQQKKNNKQAKETYH